ncbi:MAG: cell division protein FtsA [Rickettsiaceae bacterium]|nr:cell division protein FtsA [Rickettsiaceae bacterium]
MKSKVTNFIAFDIGTSKIAALAANINKQGLVKVIAQILHYSEGFNSGIITDLSAAENSLISAIYALEKDCDRSIKEVAVCLSGTGMKSYYVNNKIKLSNQAITKQDIKKLIQKVLADFKVKDKEIIHYFPIEFVLDQNSVVDNPIGMYGRELQCQVHVIAANSSMLVNLTSCLAKCQVEVNDIMLSIYASGLACLNEDEKELGSVIVDIGSHTTGIGIFLRGKLIYAGYVPLGSSHITSDIAKELSISLDAAEKIKVLYGSAIITSFNKDNTIRIEDFEPDNGYGADLTITSTHLASIINPKITEILYQVKEQYDHIKVGDLLARRMVITGGGASLSGIKNLAADIFNKQVRIAKPENLPGFAENYNPYMYASVIGMVKCQAMKYEKNALRLEEDENINWLRKTFLWLKENI